MGDSYKRPKWAQRKIQNIYRHYALHVVFLFGRRGKKIYRNARKKEKIRTRKISEILTYFLFSPFKFSIFGEPFLCENCRLGLKTFFSLSGKKIFFFCEELHFSHPYPRGKLSQRVHLLLIFPFDVDHDIRYLSLGFFKRA